MFLNFSRTNLAVALTALTLTLGAGAAGATVYIPTKAEDTNDGACDADCSLREAVIAANAHPGADVILLEPGSYLLTVTGAGEDAAAFGDLDILDDLTIIGEDPLTTSILAPNINIPGDRDRILHVLAGGSADLRGLSLEGTEVAGSGGNILNAGTVTLNQVLVRGGQSSGAGGAIASTGTLRVIDSVVMNGFAGTVGGGIHASGTVEIVNSTIAKNQAAGPYGGGIYFVANTDAVINNSTITDNLSAGVGGGVFVESSAFIGQHAPRFTNSIIAKNYTNAAPSDCSGAPLSGGYNLVGLGGGCGDFNTAKFDLIGTSGTGIDPLLGGLGSNGGPTFTYAIADNSPARNAGNPAASGDDACAKTDQRGAARPANGRCDIGAFELTEACVSGGNTLCLNEGRFKVTANWTSTTGNGAAQAKSLTPETGYFYFFHPANVEATVKILNGCGFNNRYWVFLSGLTNVKVDLTVVDTKTGATKSYSNPQNMVFRTQLDTNTFATCP